MNFEAYAYNKYQFANSISAALEMYPTRDVIVIVELTSVCHLVIYGSYNSAGSWHNVLLYPQVGKGLKDGKVRSDCWSF